MGAGQQLSFPAPHLHKNGSISSRSYAFGLCCWVIANALITAICWRSYILAYSDPTLRCIRCIHHTLLVVKRNHLYNRSLQLDGAISALPHKCMQAYAALVVSCDLINWKKDYHVHIIYYHATAPTTCCFVYVPQVLHLTKVCTSGFCTDKAFSQRILYGSTSPHDPHSMLVRSSK